MTFNNFIVTLIDNSVNPKFCNILGIKTIDQVHF